MPSDASVAWIVVVSRVSFPCASLFRESNILRRPRPFDDAIKHGKRPGRSGLRLLPQNRTAVGDSIGGSPGAGAVEMGEVEIPPGLQLRGRGLIPFAALNAAQQGALDLMHPGPRVTRTHRPFTIRQWFAP